ncbi:MAG: outer membrane beta-barrel protein, partial [Chthoniobacterales bacterium]
MKQIVFIFSATIFAGIAAAGEPQIAPAAPEPRFKISGWIESGITFNPAGPRDSQNFGRLFDDRANEPLLNQLVINFERALAPKAGEF